MCISPIAEATTFDIWQVFPPIFDIQTRKEILLGLYNLYVHFYGSSINGSDRIFLKIFSVKIVLLILSVLWTMTIMVFVEETCLKNFIYSVCYAKNSSF